MLDTFALHKGGREYRRLVSAFERIFGATIFFGTDAGTPRARVVQRTRLSFSAKLRFGTVVIRTSAQLTINFRTSSCSAMSSIRRSHPTRFLRTWSKSRHFRIPLPRRTSSCGSRTAASSQKAMKAFRCSARTGWQPRLGPPNTLGPAGFEKTSRNGWILFTYFGQAAGLGSTLTARACISLARSQRYRNTRRLDGLVYLSDIPVRCIGELPQIEVTRSLAVGGNLSGP